MGYSTAFFTALSTSILYIRYPHSPSLYYAANPTVYLSKFIHEDVPVLSELSVLVLGQSYSPSMMPIRRTDRENRRTKVHFYVPDNRSSSTLFGIALRDASKANSMGMICSLYASAVTSVLHELKQDFRDALIAHDLDIVDVSLPSQADQYGVDSNYGYCLTYPNVVCLFGVSLLLILKNVSHESYNRFMNDRFKAMKAFLSSSICEPPPLPFDADQAATLRAFFGPNRDLCKKIVLFLIAKSTSEDDHPMGSCCRYLLKFLAWSDLQGFGIMYETLVQDDSSVLHDPRVRAEVEAAREAAKAVKRCGHPPYFRYLGSASDQHLVKRSRFPVLISVAVAWRKRLEESLNNFVTPVSTDDPLVRDLVRIHETIMTEEKKRRQEEMLEFLYSVVPKLLRSGPFSFDDMID